MKMRGETAWETTSPPAFDAPDLETILAMVIRADFLTPDEPVPAFYREPPSSNITVNISSLPRRVWEAIRYISAEKLQTVKSKKSAAEGAMIHCGLHVVEDLVRSSRRGMMPWLDAYVGDDQETLLSYVGKRYRTEYLGRGIGNTKKVYFLNAMDRARSMEIANTFGLSLTEVTTICMTAGIAQSIEILPRREVDQAVKEVKRFEKWLNGELQ